MSLNVRACCPVALLLAVCLIQNAAAQPAILPGDIEWWSGLAGNGLWSDPNNWIPPAVPSTNSQVSLAPANGSSVVTVVSGEKAGAASVSGPTSGMTLNVYGTLHSGLYLVPVADLTQSASVVNVYGDSGSVSADNIFLGDVWWYPGGPHVEFNLYESSALNTPWLALGGHLNLYDSSTATISSYLLTGTANGGVFAGSLSSDATRWVNLAGGKLILGTGNSNYVTTLVGRGIFLCYGKKSDTNEFSITDDGTNTVVAVPALGTLQDVTLELPRSTMMAGTFQEARVLGDFSGVSGVPLSTLDAAQLGGGIITYQLSSPGVASVTGTGRIVAVSPGTATMSATFSGGSLGTFTNNNNAIITVTPMTNSLVHRYSFNEPAGDVTTADSAGGSDWDGALQGGAALGGGRVTLDGSSGYVQFPAGIVSGMDAVTIEAWVAFGAPAASAWLYSFGDSDASSPPEGENYIGFQPYTGAGSAAALFGRGDPGSADEEGASFSLVGNGGTNYLGSVHLTVVYHPYAGYVCFYTNGVSAAVKSSVVNSLAATLGADPLNYLGRSLYGSDPFLSASIDEFRVYSGPLSAAQIAADYALGPNQLIRTATSVTLSASASPGGVVIRWPTTSALVGLMCSPSLEAGASWVPASGTLTAAGGNYQMVVPVSGAAQFFRLQHY